MTLIERGSEVGGGDVRADVGCLARVVEAAQTPDGRTLWWIAEADHQTVASLRSPVAAPSLPPAASMMACVALISCPALFIAMRWLLAAPP